ncbi:MAG TPA: tetratricopeptide repeat protein [Polyangiaceae bacterium]|nr:tetratricopeptide repeat protein [Polyangiaceae bacterium]
MISANPSLSASFTAFVLLATACASSTAVTRSVGGRLVHGRFVTDDAYTAYLRGALLEEQGNREAALTAYTEGARHDPDSPELLTKIGALICDRQEGAGTAAIGKPGAAFDRAAAIDPAYEEAWTERARCNLKRGQLAAAEHAARMAVSLDPDRIEPALLLALVLEHRERIDEAARWLQGLVVRYPASAAAQEAMAAFAERTHDEARRAAAERALAELGARTNRRNRAVKVRPTVADVDAAIARGAFDDARRLALSARVSSGALALRAAAVGAAAFAQSQAELVLAADPRDADARVAAAIAADLLRDDDALARAMAEARLVDTTISPLAHLLMAELLERRVGPDARKAWMDAVGTPMNESVDALAREVAKRR